MKLEGRDSATVAEASTNGDRTLSRRVHRQADAFEEVTTIVCHLERLVRQEIVQDRRAAPDDPIEKTFEHGAVEHEEERSRLVWHPPTSAPRTLLRQMARRAMRRLIYRLGRAMSDYAAGAGRMTPGVAAHDVRPAGPLEDDLAPVGIACTPHRDMVGAGASVRKTLLATCPWARQLGLSVSWSSCSRC